MSSKEADDQGEVICRRDLTGTFDGLERSVSISIFKPLAFGDSFACAYRIDGLGSELDLGNERPYFGRALGADSVQAITLALAAITLRLRPHEASLAWFGDRGWHGFPLVREYSNDYGPEFRRHIEEVLDREVEQFLVRRYGAELIKPVRPKSPPL